MEVETKPNQKKKKTRISIAQKTLKKHPKYNKKSSTQKKPKLRSSITLGTILIQLTGSHKGKRSVFLGQLPSGFLCVTGPFKTNGVPLRRVCPSHVIATSTKIDLDGFSLPTKITDEFLSGRKKCDEESKGKWTNDWMTLQNEVDGFVLAAIKKREDSKSIKGYLRALFFLQKGDKPHLMKF